MRGGTTQTLGSALGWGHGCLLLGLWLTLEAVFPLVREKTDAISHRLAVLTSPRLRSGLGPHLLTHAQARSSEQRKQQMTCQCPGQLCAIQAFLKPEAEGLEVAESPG